MINLSILLSAIALVESGNNDDAIGRHGERSRYQITATVWRQHMAPLSFENCCWGSRAKLCASRHLNWLIRQGVWSNPRQLAIAWNGGFARYCRCCQGSLATRRYAERVERTYNDLIAKQRRRIP